MKVLMLLLLTALTLTAQTPAAPAQGGLDPSFFIILIVGFIVLQFMIVGPQKKKEKELVKKRDSLVKGDEVVTIGGLCATVKKVEGDRVVLTIDKSATVTMLKSAIATINSSEKSVPEVKAE